MPIEAPCKANLRSAKGHLLTSRLQGRCSPATVKIIVAPFSADFFSLSQMRLTKCLPGGQFLRSPGCRAVTVTDYNGLTLRIRSAEAYIYPNTPEYLRV